MKISSEDIKKVAKLANLPVSQEEDEKYSEQLSKVFDYIDHLSSVETENIDPIYDVSPNKNITREDIVANSLNQEEAIKNASNHKNGFFVTKGVFENE